jgi:hypothetical protein
MRSLLYIYHYSNCTICGVWPYYPPADFIFESTVLTVKVFCLPVLGFYLTNTNQSTCVCSRANVTWGLVLASLSGGPRFNSRRTRAAVAVSVCAFYYHFSCITSLRVRKSISFREPCAVGIRTFFFFNNFTTVVCF